jgi:hypothetical protein
VFFWLAFILWSASFVLTVMDWRTGKASRPIDPPFIPPVSDDQDDDADEESAYSRPVGHRDSTVDHGPPDGYPANVPSIPPISSPDESIPTYQPADSYAPPTSRPSMDVYGAFSDPVPSGYSNPNPYSPPDSSGVSRTMQYADPYAAVRANLTSKQPPGPPSYG